MGMFRSLEIRSNSNKQIYLERTVSNIKNLPEKDVLIEVKYAAINYTDALFLTGKKSSGGVSVAGSDAVGVVISSNVSEFIKGDEVVVSGYVFGTELPGSFGGVISAPADMVNLIPIGISLKEAATLGSAAIAAGMGVLDLINSGVTPSDKYKVAVTNASFNYGAVALSLFAKLGYDVTAYVQDDSASKDYASALNATTIKPLSSLKETFFNELNEPLFDGAYDICGSSILASICSYMKNNGVVVSAGHIKDDMSRIPLKPFINRGINIVGANALFSSKKLRETVWQYLATEWRLDNTGWLCHEISIEDVEKFLPLILAKETKGRILINHSL